MTTPFVSNDKHNFQCVTVASVNFIKLPLIDILTKNIKPVDLYRKISSCKDLLQGKSKLSYDQRQVCYITPPGIPDYSRFDVTLLYKLIRHLCSLPSPTQGWGKPPQTTDTRISDDIERLRMFRNNYYAHAKSAAIPDSVFGTIWMDLNDVITRIQTNLHGSIDYQKELLDIKSYKCTIQHFETCKVLLEAYLKFQTDDKDEPGFSIKGEDKVICGGIAQIEAEVTGIETACRSITWQKRKGKDFEDINTRDEKYSGSTNKILVIQSVCKEDEGDYRAILSLESNENDHEKSRNTIRLTVLGELPCLNDLNVTTGDEEVKIHCSYEVLELSPKVQSIEWRRDGKLLYMKSQNFVGGNVKECCFTIPSPSKEDTGNYSCTLISAVGSVSKDVTIGFPRAQISVDHKDIHVGSEIKIMSIDISNPPADKFEWQKSKDGKVFASIDITKPKYFGSNRTSKHPILVIPKATFEDKLYYRLVLWNKFGEDVSNTVDINITGSVPNISTTQYTNINEKSVKLIGTVFTDCDSPPINEVYWTKNGDSIDIQGSGGRLFTDNHDLIIKNVGQDDAGDYRLTASNSVGSTTSEVIVLGPPLVFVERNEDKENGSLLFKARIEAIPTPYHIQWSKRGTCDNSSTPVDVNAEEYKGSTNSLPHPVLVLNNRTELENNSYQITVTNFVGSTVCSDSEKEEVYTKGDLPKDCSSISAQYAITCALCEKSAVYYCKPCGLKLCWECKIKHLAKNKHNRMEKSNNPFIECNSHFTETCLFYCKDCNIPTCVTCVTSDHRKHNFISLQDFLNEKKENILNEIQELETTSLPELKRHTSGVDREKYKQTISKISVHEELICKAVREAGTNLKSLVHKQMKENLEKTEKNTLEETAIVRMIRETKRLLERNNPIEVLQFKGIKCQVKICPLIVDRNTPVFQGTTLQEGVIQNLLGSLVNSKDMNTEIGANIHVLMKQIWFHGFIPKKEAEQFLKRNGDFLVWEMMNNTEQDRFVISSYHNGALHFKVTAEYIVVKVGQNTTLVDLINHLVSSGQPLSNDNPSTLKFPVDRKQHQIDRCQITLGSKIENITKGDMLDGTFGTLKVLVCIDNECEIRLFKNINLLRELIHPNIVDMEGYSALQKPVFLVLENMTGSLLTCLRRNKAFMSTKKRTEMCHDVSKGMDFLHRQNFIHSDVAARNCLVTDGGIVKIYDFWMTVQGKEYQLQHDQINHLHIKWTAPETLVSGKLTLLSDVWSFGILMWEIFSSGKCPYPQFTDVETKEKVLKGYKMDSPENMPKSCYSLMQKCWELRSAKRSHFKDLVKKLQSMIKKMKL